MESPVLKSIAYISKVKETGNGSALPLGLFDIYQTSRNQNSIREITSGLAYRNGHYLQILEGKAEHIEPLMKNIRLDVRHEQIITIVDTAIAERIFANKGMVLLTSLTNNPLFQTFVEKNADALSRLDENSANLFSLFGNVSRSIVEDVTSFTNKRISMTNWPDYSEIKNVDSAVELCAYLTKNPTDYVNLIENPEFGSKTEIDTLLERFNRNGLLELTNSITQPEPPRKKIAKENGFYQRMRSFLSFGASR